MFKTPQFCPSKTLQPYEVFRLVILLIDSEATYQKNCRSVAREFSRGGPLGMDPLYEELGKFRSSLDALKERIVDNSDIQ